MTRDSAKAGSLGADLLQISALIWRAARALLVPLSRRALGLQVSNAEIGIRLRTFLDRNGVVTRKLGQFLALRLDILPREICEKLDELFDSSEPMDFATVRDLVQSELNGPLLDHFRSFDEAPIAVASIAQVHRAVACDGQVLAIKVQRAGIAQAFFSEIRNLRRFARVNDFLRLTGSISAKEALDEFADFTEAELHFDREGATADRLRLGLRPGCHVPEIRWDLTTARVLAMEFIDGYTVLAICRMYESGKAAEIARALPGVDLVATINRIADECFHQIFDTGFFHGDPNPGNIMIRKDGSFVFLDCGIFGELSPHEQRNLIGYQESLVHGRFLRSARYYIRLSEPTPATRMTNLEDDLAALLAQWHNALRNLELPIEQRHLSVWQGKVVCLLRRHRVRSR
jgi:ubiquinone biosynthesis protein